VVELNTAMFEGLCVALAGERVMPVKSGNVQAQGHSWTVRWRRGRMGGLQLLSLDAVVHALCEYTQLSTSPEASCSSNELQKKSAAEHAGATRTCSTPDVCHASASPYAVLPCTFSALPLRSLHLPHACSLSSWALSSRKHYPLPRNYTSLE
jgi:hypothetical protein